MGIVARIRWYGGEIAPGSLGCPETGTHLHGSVYASHRRPTSFITDARPAKSCLSPIVALSRVHVFAISGRVWRRGLRHREKLSECRAIWSQIREVDRHFVNPTCFFALPTPPFSRHATRAPSRRPSPSPLEVTNLALPRRRGVEIRQRIGRQLCGEGRRADARISQLHLCSCLVCARARAHIAPEKRLLDET